MSKTKIIYKNKIISDKKIDVIEIETDFEHGYLKIFTDNSLIFDQKLFKS